MLASSAFVLTALTMTGIYMQNKNKESKDNGYTLDFTALEENAENKYQEIARGNTGDSDISESAEQLLKGDGTGTSVIDNTEDDLDYMPMEVGSGNVEIPGLTGILTRIPFLNDAVIRARLMTTLLKLSFSLTVGIGVVKGIIILQLIDTGTNHFAIADG